MEKVKRHWLKIILSQGYVFLFYVGIEAAVLSFPENHCFKKYAGYSFFCFWVTKFNDGKLWMSCGLRGL